MQVRALIERSEKLLPASPTARLDVELLLAHALKKPRSWLYANPRAMLNAQASQLLDKLLAQRKAGVPVAYLTGAREFWSISLRVTPDVLIPRPETELLVELALGQLPRDRVSRIADLGTGSGCIALALASELPQARIVATEASARALDVARMNAKRLGIERHQLEFRHGDWFGPLAGERFDCVVCNPPYVRDDDPHLMEDIRHEPRTALAGGPDGLDAIRAIVAEAPLHLNRGGLLLLEHGADQQDEVASMLEQSGAQVGRHKDLAELPRAVVARFR